jgi:hypothetical protein
MFGIFIDPDDGGEIFLQDVFILSTNYTALYPRIRTLHVQFCRIRFELFTAVKV